jgi:hypothetical protein
MENEGKNLKDSLQNSEAIALDLQNWKLHTEKQFETTTKALESMRYDLARNTSATLRCSADIQAVKSNTADVVTLLEVFKAGRKITVGLGTFALWCMSIISTVTLFVQAIRGKLW